jgi:nitroreductase
MNTAQAIRARRSIRRYKPGIVIPQEHIDRMLEAAMCAPSARNIRPWSFVVIESAQVRSLIVEGTGSNRFLNDASLAIVVCGDPGPMPSGAKEGFWPQDCAAATQNLMLQALELGYGTCWCGVHPGARTPVLTEILGLQGVVPLSLIAVGVPDETPAAKSVYDRSKVRYVR